MTEAEFNKFIASVESEFIPNLGELQMAVREAAQAHARFLKAQLAKPRHQGIQYAANAACYPTGPESTWTVYQRCKRTLWEAVQKAGRP